MSSNKGNALKSNLRATGTYIAEFRKAVGECDLSRIPAYVETIIDGELWKDRIQGTSGVLHNDSLVEFITSTPLKGMGWELDKIKHLLRQAGNGKVLKKWRKATTAPKHKHNGDSHPVTIKPERGNSQAYILTRLEEADRNDLVERVALPKRDPNRLTAKAAAREAGFKGYEKHKHKCPNCGHEW